jgi:hypothetical protein
MIFREPLRELADAIEEELRNGTDRPVFQSDDRYREPPTRQLDGEHLEHRPLSPEAQHRPGNHGEKPPACQQIVAQMERLTPDGCPWPVDADRTNPLLSPEVSASGPAKLPSCAMDSHSLAVGLIVPAIGSIQHVAPGVSQTEAHPPAAH